VSERLVHTKIFEQGQRKMKRQINPTTIFVDRVAYQRAIEEYCAERQIIIGHYLSLADIVNFGGCVVHRLRLVPMRPRRPVSARIAATTKWK
jgi:hypothetical protein